MVRPRYWSTQITSRGMVSAVRQLAARGLVQLLTDAQGRLVVALLGPLSRPSNPLGDGMASVHLTVFSAGASGSSSPPLLDEVMPTQEAITRLVGLGRPVEQPSEEQLRAAVPAALWSGPQARERWLGLLRLHAWLLAAGRPSNAAPPSPPHSTSLAVPDVCLCHPPKHI